MKTIMNYEEFKNVLLEELRDYLPEDMSGVEITISPVYKVNCQRDAINLNGSGSKIIPTMYADILYEHYQEYGELQATLKYAGEIFAKAMEEEVVQIGDINFDNAADNIAYQFVNTLQNQKMLAGVPHRTWNDLSIVYRWVLKNDKEGMQSILITNKLANHIGMSECELYDVAKENTRRMFPAQVVSMNELLRMFQMDMEISDEIMDECISENVPEIPFYCISNRMQTNGAISILQEDVLQNLADKVEDDLFIFPSSIHECLILPVAYGEVEECAQMVLTINASSVRMEERLSNQIYRYSRDEKKILLVSNSPESIKSY